MKSYGNEKIFTWIPASTTLNIYTHFLESTDKKSADILENVLAKQA